MKFYFKSRETGGIGEYIMMVVRITTSCLWHCSKCFARVKCIKHDNVYITNLKCLNSAWYIQWPTDSEISYSNSVIYDGDKSKVWPVLLTELTREPKPRSASVGLCWVLRPCWASFSSEAHPCASGVSWESFLTPCFSGLPVPGLKVSF